MGFSKNLVVEAGSSQYLKTPPGTTVVRVVSEAIQVWKDFDNKKHYLTKELALSNPNAKPRYSMWVIDRGDGKIKIWECAGGIVKDLQNLSNKAEYAFENLPPYDVSIDRVGTTQNDTRYTITPARKDSELTEAEKLEVTGLESVIDFLKNEPGFVNTSDEIAA